MSLYFFSYEISNKTKVATQTTEGYSRIAFKDYNSEEQSEGAYFDELESAIKTMLKQHYVSVDANSFNLKNISKIV